MTSQVTVTEVSQIIQVARWAGMNLGWTLGEVKKMTEALVAAQDDFDESLDVLETYLGTYIDIKRN